MVFELFDKKLKTVVQERFSKPTHIQEKAIPEILGGKNVLVISETGSGKTESVVFPVFNLFLKKEHKPISILYITPLKSLNRDLFKRLLWWSKKLDFEVAVRHGDTSQYERSMQAANPSDMMISTPETLQSILVGKVMRQHLKNVKWVIIDEIHELVENKRGVQLSLALERLRRLAGHFHLIGLSATIGSPERVAAFLGEDFTVIDAAKEKTIDLKVDSPKARREDTLLANKMRLGPDTMARVREIHDQIKKKTSVLVFTNTRQSAEVLSSRLKVFDPKLPIEAHHSSLAKEVRIKAEQEFRDQKVKALLCTSSLELGIDIGTIDFVLQFMSPRQVMKFLQRVGRAGHSIKEISSGLILAGDGDDAFESTAIARDAVTRKIEETKIFDKALDVLGHQVVGLTLEDYEIPLDKAYKIVKKSYPYRDLTPEEFFQVCQLMERLRVLWINDKDDQFVERYKRGDVAKEDRFKGKRLGDLFLRRRKNAWLYYYSNLSTIPDVQTYRVHDVYSNQPVGTLDAEFIALNGGPGQAVIVKGQAWRILDVGRTKVMVEPMAGIEAAIPAWQGDLIPVPFDIAQSVGQLRRDIAARLKKKQDPIPFLLKEAPVTRALAKKLVKTVRGQQTWGFVPDHENLLIEYDTENIIIHTCWGSLINDTVGRVLSVLLTDSLGSVGLQTDPYRIILKTAGWGWKEAAQVFMELNPRKVRKTLLESLPLTQLYQWRFLHVAKRLGIIDRNADFGKAYLKKIIEVYSDTPVHEEALNEIFQDKLDVPGAERVLKQLKNKELKITIREGISPLARSALAQKYEIVPPDRPEKEIFDIFKKRLFDTKLGLVCCNKGDWASIKQVKSIPKNLVCPKCKAKLIAVVPRRYLLEAQELVKKHKANKRMDKEEQGWFEYMTDVASLILNNGKDAALTLAGRGVGRRTAARILTKQEKGDDLVREILKAERNYVKTRRFWQDR